MLQVLGIWSENVMIAKLGTMSEALAYDQIAGRAGKNLVKANGEFLLGPNSKMRLHPLVRSAADSVRWALLKESQTMDA